MTIHQEERMSDEALLRNVRETLEADVLMPLYLARARATTENGDPDLESERFWSRLESQLERGSERLALEVRGGVVWLQSDSLSRAEQEACARVASRVPGVRHVAAVRRR